MLAVVVEAVVVGERKSLLVVLVVAVLALDQQH
jgi:hypothetical protein